MTVKYRKPIPVGYSIRANQWYAIGSSIRGNTLTTAKVGNASLLVIRGKAGGLRVMPRFCPHLGADLAKGKAHGDGVVCPFHGLRFPNANPLLQARP